jgi:hypothetical protein
MYHKWTHTLISGHPLHDDEATDGHIQAPGIGLCPEAAIQQKQAAQEPPGFREIEQIGGSAQNIRRAEIYAVRRNITIALTEAM